MFSPMLMMNGVLILALLGVWGLTVVAVPAGSSLFLSSFVTSDRSSFGNAALLSRDASVRGRCPPQALIDLQGRCY